MILVCRHLPSYKGLYKKLIIIEKVVVKMIECTVLGYSSRPYDFKDSSGKRLTGTSYKVSVLFGDYPNDDTVTGIGQRAGEYRCNENLLGSASVGDVILAEFDDKQTKIKSAMLKTGEGSFMSIK